jgi:hypothetical protein
MYPTKLTKIINLFESLPEDERRETLVSYADNAKNQSLAKADLIWSMHKKRRNAGHRGRLPACGRETGRRTFA